MHLLVKRILNTFNDYLKNWKTLRPNNQMAYKVVDRIVPIFEESSTVPCN